MRPEQIPAGRYSSEGLSKKLLALRPRKASGFVLLVVLVASLMIPTTGTAATVEEQASQFPLDFSFKLGHAADTLSNDHASSGTLAPPTTTATTTTTVTTTSQPQPRTHPGPITTIAPTTTRVIIPTTTQTTTTRDSRTSTQSTTSGTITSSTLKTVSTSGTTTITSSSTSIPSTTTTVTTPTTTTSTTTTTSGATTYTTTESSTVTTTTQATNGPSYIIFVDPVDPGMIKAKNGITGKIDFSGTDAAAVLQRAIDALSGTGGSILLAQGTYVWQSVPALPRNLPYWLTITGENEVIIQLTSNGPRAFDFRKTADYDTFQNIRLENMTIDCNNVGGRDHVVLGTYQRNVVQSRINLQNIIIRNIVTKNVPVDPRADSPSSPLSSHRRNICLIVNQPSVGEPQTVIRDIRIENCDLRGGNAGIEIAGAGPDAVGLNIFIDGIYIYNCKHSMLSAQTLPFDSANFQVGSRGFGGYAHIARCYGEYSGDVGVEINAINALVENTIIRDAAQVAFYHTNYNRPQSGNKQLVVFENCLAQKIDLSSSLEGGGWGVSSHLNVGLGTLIIDHCDFQSSTSSFRTGEAVGVRPSSGMTALTINNFRSIIDGTSYSAPSENRINPVMIGVTGGTVCTTLRNVELIVRGKRQPGAGILLVRGIILQGEATIDLQDIRVDLQVMNMPAYSMCGIDVGGGVQATLHGTIQRFTVSCITDDASPAGIVIQGNATLTIDDQLLFKDCDFSAMTKGYEVRFARGNENKDRVYFSDIRWGTQ